MQEEIAELVHPVLSYGLLLQERLRRGERPDFDTEQAVLKGRLGSELEARRVPEYGGDPRGDDGFGGAERFLGIRYALTCWLDELFTEKGSPWERRWNEKKLESALYGSQERAFRFWEQARLAEVRTTPDAIEVFYLCVVLGFRGELEGRPERLAAWVLPTQTRLARSLPQELTLPPQQEFRPNVPPRTGRDQLQTMVMVWGAVILVLVPAGIFYLTLLLAGSR